MATCGCDKKMYSEKAMEEFRHPKNVGVIKNASGIGKVGNPSCGDILEIFVKISKNKKGEEIIKAISFRTFGCVIAIANSSLLTKMVKGKAIKEVEKITKKDLIKELGKMPPAKYHCSILALDALHDAIQDYRNKKASVVNK